MQTQVMTAAPVGRQSPGLRIDTSAGRSGGQPQRQQQQQQPRQQIQQYQLQPDPNSTTYYHEHADEEEYNHGSTAAAEAEAQSIMEDDSPPSDADSFSDELSSSPSIPDEDINFELVYALHTFLATVEGQASVVKGDSLTLLDDANSYWWLVRVLKTQAVGYIPAENIETPWERLARLNKHKNVDLTSATHEDAITGTHSALARSRFVDPSLPMYITPPAPNVKIRPQDVPPHLQPHGRRVEFTAPTYYEHSGNEYDDDEEEEDEEMTDEEGEEDEDGIEGEDGEGEGYEEEYGDQDGEGSPAELEEKEEKAMADAKRREEEIEQRKKEANKKAVEALMSVDEGEEGGDEDDGMDEGEDGPYDARDVKGRQQQQLLQAQQQPQAVQRGPSPTQALGQKPSNQEPARGPSPAQAPPAGARRLRSLDEEGERSGSPFGENAGTRKITLTPQIAREGPNDSPSEEGGSYKNGGAAIPPSQLQQQRNNLQQQPQQQQQPQGQGQGQGKVSGDRRVRDRDRDRDVEVGSNEAGLESVTSIESGSFGGSDEGHRKSGSSMGTSISSGKDGKKGKKDEDEAGGKKKKSGGILGGLFRRKDKNKKKDKDDSDSNAGRSSEDSALSPRASPVQNPKHSKLLPISTGPISSLQGGPNSTDPRRSVAGGTDSMFGKDAALRQQQIEAQQVMYRQFGIQRAPGDQTNTLTLQTPTSGLASPTSPTARMRPGSLIGSPGLGGLEVPLLNVLRVFAGEDIDSEATFKTVLLNTSTTTGDLVKQAMQRFRLPAEEMDFFYLTVKEMGGEESELKPEDKPLSVFENLADATGSGSTPVPSVKRSSVGSISSISSNLSLNPAITRLGMNDFSDDSVVKLYINRRRSGIRSGATLEHGSRADEVRRRELTGATPTPTQLNPYPERGSSPTASPSVRFAMRIQIHPEDLPEGSVFDPATNAIIPKHTLAERNRSPRSSASAGVSPFVREKIFFFPRNATVAEVIETSLDRFGIVEGVVDGGDDVEDKLSKRRSVSRVRYCLAVDANGQENVLSPSGKVLDVYSKPPLFKQTERSSKEFRRRSSDSALILGTSQDVQPDDPIFVLRRASPRPLRHSGVANAAVDELALRQQHQQQTHQPPSQPPSTRPIPSRSGTNLSTRTGESEYVTPTEELPPPSMSPASAQSPPVSRQDAIAAQRAASRANQEKAILSAQKNADKGVDITLNDRALIRSSRNFGDGKVRYSYIDQDGAEFDISEIVENEWRKPARDEREMQSASRTSSKGLGSSGDDAFASAPSSPMSEVSAFSNRIPPSEADDAAEEELAIDAVRTAALTVGPRQPERRPSPIPGSTSRTDRVEGDYLQEALERQRASPYFDETLEERIDRVLAKVKSGGVSKQAGIASALRNQHDRSTTGGTKPASLRSPSDADSASRSIPARLAATLSNNSGRNSPAQQNGSGASSPNLGGRRSPGANLDRASPSIDKLVASRVKSPSTDQKRAAQDEAATPGKSRHQQQASLGSLVSDSSSSPTTTSPSTPQTGSAIGTNFTSALSAERNESALSARGPIVYHENFGLDILMRLVDGSSSAKKHARRKPVIGVDEIFGPAVRSEDRPKDPHIREWLDDVTRSYDTVESKLDDLLAELLQS